MLSPSLLVGLLATLGVANAAVVDVWYVLELFPLRRRSQRSRWNITYTQANPDGLFERQVIGVNGTWPYVFFT